VPSVVPALLSIWSVVSRSVDSTSIIVCKNKRIFNHKVFSGIAQRSKNSMGWFFGFKLHIVASDTGELNHTEFADEGALILL
jgi:hypothetical protein